MPSFACLLGPAAHRSPRGRRVHRADTIDVTPTRPEHVLLVADAIRYLVGKWHQVAGGAGRLPALGVSTRSSAADVTTAW